MATALTALFASVREGNRSEVSRILGNTENTRLVNNPGDYNETLLHFAAEGGDKEICNLLLVAGARCDIVNAQKHTPLHRAAFKGNHEALAAMLRHGGNAVINCVDPNGWTALHYAAKFGSLESVMVLVQAGASLTQMNSQGQTALKIARVAKKANVENYLLKREQKQGSAPYKDINDHGEAIIEAHQHVMKTALWSDTHTRVVFLGDRATGKTSLSKVIFGGKFNEAEKPTRVADIDSRVAEINYKQTTNWKFSRTVEQDAAVLQRSFEDHVTGHIFLYMHKKRQQSKRAIPPETVTKGEGGNLSASAPNSSPHVEARSSPFAEYVKIDMPPSPVLPFTVENDTAKVLPEYYVSDMSIETFSDYLTHTLSRSQLESILNWWPKRKKLSEMPMLNHVVSDGSSGRAISAQERCCLMCVSEFGGEPVLINLCPLLFAPGCVYMVTFDVSAEDEATAWRSAGFQTIDATIVTKEEALVEWLCTCMSTAGVHDELHFPIILPPSHPRLPVIMILLTKTDQNSHQAKVVQLDKALNENIPRVMLHQQGEPQNQVILYSTSSRKSEPERENEPEHENEAKRINETKRKILLRDLETLACRSMFSFAQHIPHSWSKIYNYLVNMRQSRKKTFIFVDHFHRLMSREALIQVDRVTLEVALRYFHGLGCISFFHRHPQLRRMIFLQPQVLLDALASLLVPPESWEFEQSRQLYLHSLQLGILERRLLYDIYDSTSHSLDFKVVLYVLDAMNVLCKHPLLDHRNSQFVVPCLVRATGTGFFPQPAADSTCGLEAEWLAFEAHDMQFPWSVYNQLVTCCCRSALGYKPRLWQRMAHIQLTNSCHLVMAHEGKRVTFRVERNSLNAPCDVCVLHSADSEAQAPTLSPPSSSGGSCCTPQLTNGSIRERESPGVWSAQSPCPVPDSKGIALIEWAKTIKTDTPKEDLPGILDDLLKARDPNVQSVGPLVFPPSVEDLSVVCPPTLHFLQSQLCCLRECWFPGLRYHLRPRHWRPQQGQEKGPILDRRWILENLSLPHVPQYLRLWWHTEK